MRRLLVFAAILFAAACSGAATDALNAPHDEIAEATGPLHLEVSDFATMAGILWVAPSVSPSSGAIEVRDTQYGSLCRYAVSGDASVNGASVALRVMFRTRLTTCTNEIRALSYSAAITVAAGSYDVTLIHEFDGKPDTVARRSVTITE